MEQRRVRFDPVWAIAAMATGVLLGLAVSVGAGHQADWQFLVYSAFVGLCIYASVLSLHLLLGPTCDRLRPSFQAPARIGISILGGIVGWEIGYVILIFAETGSIRFPLATGRTSWLLLVTIAFTVLMAALARGYHELRERLGESIKAEKELEVARSIQSRLLPPPSIDGDGFRITARNMPASFVAGDFYDVLHHEDGSIGIVIADVSGKGIGASLIMASVKAVLPFVANGAVDQTLGALNKRLVDQLEKREFVALAYARFHPSTGRLLLANAGMPDPYLLSKGSVTPIAVGGERLPLGVRLDVHYDSIEVQLKPGDRFLLLSDGIPEAPRANGDPLGYDALREMLAGMSDIDAFLGAVRAQVRGVDDDWTAVLLTAQ